MGFLHDTDTWYKIRHSGWQKNAAASKTKRFPPAKRDFPLFWMSQCVACHPAGEILYHLTASCKAPVYAHQFLGERKMLWEHSPATRASSAFASSPKLSRVFLDRNTKKMFPISFRKTQGK